MHITFFLKINVTVRLGLGLCFVLLRDRFPPIWNCRMEGPGRGPWSIYRGAVIPSSGNDPVNARVKPFILFLNVLCISQHAM